MIDQYSIGDFASKLGVTSSLLKYYEQKGLLKPEVRNAGYRYFTVRSIPLILDMIKWKNMGFSAEEVVELMQATRYEQLSDLLMSNKSAIEQQIRYLQGVLSYTEEMRVPQETYEDDNWDIGYYGDFYFLPTHDNHSFIENGTTSPLLREWQRWLPVVQPIAKSDGRDGMSGEIWWGLTVPKRFAEEQQLPLGDVVEYVPRMRMLRVLDRRPLPDQARAMPENDVMAKQMFVNVRRIAREHNLNIEGPSYFTIMSKVREGDARYSYQRIFTAVS